MFSIRLLVLLKYKFGNGIFVLTPFGISCHALLDGSPAKTMSIERNDWHCQSSLNKSAPIAVFHCSYKFFKIDIQKVQKCHQP